MYILPDFEKKLELCVITTYLIKEGYSYSHIQLDYKMNRIENKIE